MDSWLWCSKVFLLAIMVSHVSSMCHPEGVVDPDPECPDDETLALVETTAGKFEGDIDMSKDEINEIMSGKDVHRNAILSESKKWRKGSDGLVRVPYVMEAGSRARSAVQSAAASYARNTCLRLEPRRGQSDYIRVVAKGGCFSPLGRKGGSQLLSLGRGCESHGTAAHEFMHAVGFLHEQARPDRDDYVSILLQNIKPGFDRQFNKGNPREVFNILNYDYGSVMHYGAKFFSKNGQPTIVPKRSGVFIGQRQGLSQSDIAKINFLYSCSGGGRPFPPPPPATRRTRRTIRPTFPTIAPTRRTFRTQRPTRRTFRTQRPTSRPTRRTFRTSKPTFRPTVKTARTIRPTGAPSGSCTDKQSTANCKNGVRQGFNYCKQFGSSCRKTCGLC